MADPFWKRIVPLEASFGAMFGAQRDETIRPTETKGRPGTAIYGGHVVENEKDATLTDRVRYRTFSEALANAAVVSAGVRYFLNLAAGAKWKMEPVEDHPRGVELAELAEQMLIEDPDTTWARIVRRAAMYRFYGFSIQEWTMRRRNDGFLTFADIAPRPQITIERWDVAVTGEVLGVAQRNPQDQSEIYLPRGKLLYMVDDSLNDSPQGLGLFRHIAESVRRLNRYEQLEGFGFETDLRGIPIGRAPYAELKRRVDNGEITLQEAQTALAPIETFVRKHVKKPDLGLLIDSQVFQTIDEAQRPSNVPKFDVKLLEGSQTSLPDMAKAIERINLEIARVLGIESLLLGGGNQGSWALAKEKTSQFSLTVDATLDEMADSVERDLLGPLWAVNGWPIEAMPNIAVEAVQYKDAEQITAALRDLAQAGAVLDPTDPVIQEVRTILGLDSEVVAVGMGGDDGSLGGPDDETDDEEEALADDEELDPEDVE